MSRVEGLVLHRVQVGRDVVDTVGGQQAPQFSASAPILSAAGIANGSIWYSETQLTSEYTGSNASSIVSALRAARVRATCTARRAVSAATSASARRATRNPSAVDNHPHREPNLAVDDGGLQLTIAKGDDLVDDAVDPQVGVAGTAATAVDSAASASFSRGGSRKSASTCLVAVTAITVFEPRCEGFNDSVAANRVRSTALGYALLAPGLLGVVTFLLLPMLVVAWLSVQRWDLLGPIRYVGLDNWRSVLTDPSFAASLVVTALFIVIVVPHSRCSACLPLRLATEHQHRRGSRRRQGFIRLDV